MGDMILPVLMYTTMFSLYMYILYYGISEMRRLQGGFGGYTKWIISGIVVIGLIYKNPPYWTDTLDLDDSQIATGVLEYQDGNFRLIDSGDDSQDWDFNYCASISMIKLHCNGKEITVWHNDHVVYQVEKNGKIIYSIGNSNRGIITENILGIMMHIILYCVPILVVLVPYVTNLHDNEKYEELEKKLTTEKVTEETQTPIANQSEIKNVPHIKTATTQTTPRQPPNIRPAIANRPSSIGGNEDKIPQRFCKYCGTELGKIIENTDREGHIISLEYEQYKFCSNCGLDSDPNMPVKAKPKDEETVKLLMGLFLFMSGLIAPVLVIMIASGGMNILLACLGIVAIFGGITWLFIRGKIHDCPSCGRLYRKEHFCPNCGLDLSKNE